MSRPRLENRWKRALAGELRPHKALIRRIKMEDASGAAARQVLAQGHCVFFAQQFSENSQTCPVSWALIHCVTKAGV